MTTLDRAYVRKAMAEGFTYVVTLDHRDGRREPMSKHRSYAEARKALFDGKGNTIYALADIAPFVTRN
jgi:hypothetical protein